MSGSSRWTSWPINPVLTFDLVRAARRRRPFVLRVCYVAFLLLVLVGGVLGSQHGFDVPPHKMALIFEMLVGGQFLVLVLLTPAYAAGAIAEEKERKTLPFLLTTALTDEQIITGKLIGRLLDVSLILVAGAPVLFLLVFLGGIEPVLVVAAFVVTAITLLSIGSLSLLMLGLSQQAARRHRPDVWHHPGLSASPRPNWGCVQWGPLAYSNIIWAAQHLHWQAERGLAVLWSVVHTLGSYTLFHLIAAFGLWRAAIHFLRRGATEPQIRLPAHRSVLWWLSWRPRVGHAPMMWKEIFVESRFRLQGLGRIVIGVLIIASFLPAVWIWFQAMGLGLGSAKSPPIQDQLHTWVQIVGTAVACLMLLQVAGHAAGSLNSELQRQTLDALRMTWVTSRQVLFAKWVGSILSTRWAWPWLGTIWLIGVLTGALHIVCVPLLIVVWFGGAAFVASIGLCYSLCHPSALKATVATVASVLLFWGIHWWFCPGWLARSFFGGPPVDDPLMGTLLIFVSHLNAFALTPPLALALLTFSAGTDLTATTNNGPLPEVNGLAALASAADSLMMWPVVGWWFWYRQARALLRLRMWEDPVLCPVRPPWTSRRRKIARR